MALFTGRRVPSDKEATRAIARGRGRHEDLVAEDPSPGTDRPWFMDHDEPEGSRRHSRRQARRRRILVIASVAVLLVLGIALAGLAWLELRSGR